MVFDRVLLGWHGACLEAGQSEGASCLSRRWWLHRVCMSRPRSPCDARSDASWSTSHPLMHRNLPPWWMAALSGRRATRASPGQSKPPLVHVTGGRSRPPRMARYVVGCRPLHKMLHAPVVDGGCTGCACLVKRRHAMLDLTHPNRLSITSCTEACRRGVWRLHLDLRLGVYIGLAENLGTKYFLIFYRKNSRVQKVPSDYNRIFMKLQGQGESL